MEAVASSEHPGFFLIPDFSNFLVSPSGSVLNANLNEEIKGWRSPSGYFNYTLRTDGGNRFLVGRHRLLAFVFKHPGVPVKKLTVNHINGNKKDDRLDNLEWVTYQRNVEHAGEHGLTSRCTPIEVRNALTGVVNRYPSIIACARELGVTKDFVNWRVKNGKGRTFPEGSQYRAANSSDQWASETHRLLPRMGRARPVLVRELLSRRIRSYNKLGEAASAFDVPLVTAYTWANASDQPVLPGLLQMKWAENSTPWREVEDPYRELELFTGKRVVKITRPSTGESTIYESAAECARDCAISPTLLNYRLNSNRQTPFPDGLVYEYYNKPRTSEVDGPATQQWIAECSLIAGTP